MPTGWLWLWMWWLWGVVALGAEEPKGKEEEKPADLIDEAISAQTGISTAELRFMRKSMSRLNFVQSKLLELKNVKKAQFDAVPKLKHQRPEQLPILFEGDMLLTPRQMHAIVQNAEHQLFLKDIGRMDLMEKGNSKRRRFRRTLIANPVARWTEMPIPFTVADQHNANRSAVLNGVRVWEERTCLRFEEVNGTQFRPHIRFIRGSGCYSNVGRSSPTGQILSVGRGCENPFIVAHEIGHALGFFHEQGRFDRDKYVRIQSDNIHVGFLNQFTKQDPQQIQTFGVEYDIGSVMHYDQYSFSSTGSPAIRSVDPNYQMTMGQREEVTFNDVKKINSAYCDKCPKTLKCQNSGYTDPLNCSRCRCPTGLGGKYCSRPLKTADSEKCGQLLRTATSAQQTVELSGPLQCNLLIRAADGAKIQLRVEEVQFLPSLPCRRDYLELKYGKDFGTTGARLCSAAVPMRNLIAAANEALILYRSGSTYSKVKISFSSDEAPSPIHLFTNTLTIFSDFFRSIFHTTSFGQPNVEYDDKDEDDETDETPQTPSDDVPIAVGLPKTTEKSNITENLTKETSTTAKPVTSTQKLTEITTASVTQTTAAPTTTSTVIPVEVTTGKLAETSAATTQTNTTAKTTEKMDSTTEAIPKNITTSKTTLEITSTTPSAEPVTTPSSENITINNTEETKFTTSIPADLNLFNETDIDDFPIPTAIDPLAELLSRATIDAVETEFERVQKELTEKKNETEIVFITSEELVVKENKAEKKVMIFEDNDLLWDALKRLRNGTAAIAGKKNSTIANNVVNISDDLKNVTEVMPIKSATVNMKDELAEVKLVPTYASCKNPISVKFNETLPVPAMAENQTTVSETVSATELEKASPENNTTLHTTAESPSMQHSSAENTTSPTVPSSTTTTPPMTSSLPSTHDDLEGSGIEDILAEGFLVTAEHIPTFAELPLEYRRKPLRKPPKQQKDEILLSEVEGSGSGDFYTIIN